MKHNQGFTLIELLFITSIIGLFAAITVPSLLSTDKALQNATNIVVGNFKQVRAKAMMSTSAYRVKPVSAKQLVAQFAKNCSAEESEWKTDSDLNVDLPKNVEFDSTATVDNVIVESTTSQGAWELCYNSRGLADKNLIITLNDLQNNRVRTTEVLLGGAVTTGSEMPASNLN